MPKPKKKQPPASLPGAKPVFIRVPPAARQALETLALETQRHLQAELAFALHDYLAHPPAVAAVPEELRAAVHGTKAIRAVVPVALWDALTIRAEAEGRPIGVEVGLAIQHHAEKGARPMPKGILM